MKDYHCPDGLDSSTTRSQSSSSLLGPLLLLVDAFHAPSPVETRVETVPGAIVVVKCWKSTQKPLTKEFYYNYELLASLLRPRYLRVSDRHVSPLNCERTVQYGFAQHTPSIHDDPAAKNATHHAIAC